jgi:hypothetical protein
MRLGDTKSEGGALSTWVFVQSMSLLTSAAAVAITRAGRSGGDRPRSFCKVNGPSEPA